MIAYCYRSGQIGLASKNAPAGTIILVRGPRKRVEYAVSAAARLAYDNQTMLVPGIPEAENDEDAYQSMVRFSDRLIAAVRSKTAVRR